LSHISQIIIMCSFNVLPYIGMTASSGTVIDLGSLVWIFDMVVFLAMANKTDCCVE
jgi:hypothetical protein